MRRLATGTLLLTTMACGCWRFHPMEPTRLLFKADLAADPVQAGWSVQKPQDGAAAPSWNAEAGCLAAEGGWWQSPSVPVEPFRWYRLEFRSRAQGKAYWAAVFFDAEGRQLDADHYSSFEPSADWARQVFCFRGKARAVAAQVRFQPLDRKAIEVADVAVSGVGHEAVASWADEVYAGIPPVRWVPPPGRWKLIPRTMQRLRKGGRLRIVMLGDSIANDTGNSPFDVLLGRAYPRARLEVITSVRGGTGCQYYKDEGRVRQYVADYQPDLLVIGGISHGADAEAVRSVVRQVRALCGCEILVTTGAICPRATIDENFAKWAKKQGLAKAPTVADYQRDLERVCREEAAEFLDLRAAWDAYVAGSGRPDEWFMRDPVHANARGRQAVARILARYFAPVADDTPKHSLGVAPPVPQGEVRVPRPNSFGRAGRETPRNGSNFAPGEGEAHAR